jgi:hypothetical protein
VPRKTKAPEFVEAEEMAAARHVKTASIRTAVSKARKVKEKTGDWPDTPGTIPEPDETRPRIKWRRARVDVREFMRPKLPLLHDGAELAAAIKRLGSASAVAKEAGCTKMAVIDACDRHGIELAEGTVPSVLDGVPLADLLAARQRPDGSRRTVEEAASELGVSHHTYRRALRRAEAAVQRAEAAAQTSAGVDDGEQSAGADEEALVGAGAQ